MCVVWTAFSSVWAGWLVLLYAVNVDYSSWKLLRRKWYTSWAPRRRQVWIELFLEWLSENIMVKLLLIYCGEIAIWLDTLFIKLLPLDHRSVDLNYNDISEAIWIPVTSWQGFRYGTLIMWLRSTSTGRTTVENKLTFLHGRDIWTQLIRLRNVGFLDSKDPVWWHMATHSCDSSYVCLTRCNTVRCLHH